MRFRTGRFTTTSPRACPWIRALPLSSGSVGIREALAATKISIREGWILR